MFYIFCHWSSDEKLNLVYENNMNIVSLMLKMLGVNTFKIKSKMLVLVDLLLYEKQLDTVLLLLTFFGKEANYF